MEIIAVDSGELGNYAYIEVMPGTYACPEAGRVLFVQPDESCILVIQRP
jgi:hypothetical protein